MTEHEAAEDDGGRLGVIGETMQIALVIIVALCHSPIGTFKALIGRA
jgi:hypothetical protein